jgi:hypothetical protein
VDARFTFGLAFKNIRYFKSKVILVLIGFIFALALLSSVIVWSNTSERIVLAEFSESTDYFMYASSFLPNDALAVADYLNNESIIDYYDISLLSQSIFNSENKNNTYRFYPLDDQEDPDDPIIVGNVVATTLRGMDRLDILLNINGSLPKDSSETLMSINMLDQLNTELNLTLGINSTLNLAIARQIPEVDYGQFLLRFFNKIEYANITISGIFDYDGAESSLKDAYSLDNLDRAIIFPVENIIPRDILLMDNNVNHAKLMMKLNINAFYEAGVNGLFDLFYSLKDRILSRFFSATVRILDDYIENLTDEFNFSFNTVYLYLPLITLAILLSNLAAAILLDNRENQSNMLEEKGATSSNLVSLISSEFLIITIIGITVGLPIALLLSTLIPAIKSNGTLNFELARLFLTQMSVDFSSIYLMILIVFGIFTFFVGIQIYTAVFTKNEADEAWEQLQRFLRFGKAIFTISMVIGMVILVLNITKGTSIQEINLNQQTEMILLIVVIIFNIVWVLTSEYLSYLLVKILHSFDWFIHKLLPDVSYYINKNLRRDNQNIKRLAFFLIFLVSLLTYSTVLDATYDNNNQQMNDFLQGADLRIHTKNTYANYSDILENIPGIELTSPLYHTNARIVLTDITIYAVDVKSYLEIGRWEYAQGIGQVENLVQQLNTSEQKILISEQISNRLGHKINDSLYLSGFEQEFIVNFTIAGMINSAPGIGLAGSSNPELNQNTKGWAIVPYQAIQNNYQIGFTELFLGKLKEGANIDEVVNKIKQLPDVVVVNPSPIGENYIGYIIEPFLPSPNGVLLFIKFISLIFSVFLISLITESILTKRKRENAILISIGLSKKQLSRGILGEFILTLVCSSILGVLLGILLSIFSMQFFLPLTVKRIFVSIQFVINWVELFIMLFFIITVVSFIIYYKIRKFFQETLFENIIKET